MEYTTLLYNLLVADVLIIGGGTAVEHAPA